MNYGELAEILLNKGLYLIPCKKENAKIPAVNDWNCYEKIEDIISKCIKTHADSSNYGLLMGEGIVAVDIDFTDEKLKKDAEKILENYYTPLQRLGNKFHIATRFYYCKDSIKSKSKNQIDLLALNKFCVIPDSIHPKGYSFKWVHTKLLDFLAHNEISDLPEFDESLWEELQFIRFKSEERIKKGRHLKIVDRSEERIKKGRHLKIVDMIAAAKHKGKDLNTIVSEIYNYDQQNHNPPYFTDASEPHGGSGIKTARKMVESFGITESITNTDFLREFEKNESNINLWTKLGLDFNKKTMKLKNCTENTNKIFQYDSYFKDNLKFDEFLNRKLFQNRPLEDSDLIAIKLYLERNYRHYIKKNDLADYVDYFLKNNSVNCVKDYIKSIKWDGVKRLDGFLNVYMGVEENAYTIAVSKNFWIAMIARVMAPGCKVDNMLILEGKQGVGKSSALRAIGGDWTLENTHSCTHESFYHALQGKLLVEIAELNSFSKAEATAIKNTVSIQVDTYRPKYGRYTIAYPRQCVFVGTTNEDTYLTDSTGNRRFWSVKTTNIDVEKIKKDRDQLFAEALHRYSKGESWSEVPLDLAREEQNKRFDEDVWTDDVEKYLNQNKFQSYFITSEILNNAIQMPIDRQNKVAKNRIGKILRFFGYEYKPLRFDGVLKKVWVKKS